MKHIFIFVSILLIGFLMPMPIKKVDAEPLKLETYKAPIAAKPTVNEFVKKEPPHIIHAFTPTPIQITVSPTPLPITATPIPTPLPTSTPIPAKVYSKDSIQDMICQRFGRYCEDALIIAKNESGFQNIPSHFINPNGTRDWGIFQINDINCRPDCSAMLIPEKNIEKAYSMFVSWGNSWHAWATCHALPKCY